VADPSITGSSPTVANEKIKQYALVGYCNGSIQYLIQGELMQGCLKSSPTWTQLKFWNTRGLALKIWCQMGFCKHDKSCDSLQVRRASRIRSKNEQSPRFVGSGESVLPVRRLTCGNGGGEGRRESGKQEAFIFCTWTKLLHSLLTAFVAIRLWL